MKKFLLCLLMFLGVFLAVKAEETTVLQAGISVDKAVPDILFGEWRVSAKLLETDSRGNFKENNIDLWNISRENSVITLSNPFSGAKASISIKEVNGNRIVFEKEGTYDNQILKDRVEMTLNSDNFEGINILTLTTVSEIDGHEMGKKSAKYSLYGDKISGQNVLVEE